MFHGELMNYGQQTNLLIRNITYLKRAFSLKDKITRWGFTDC